MLAWFLAGRWSPHLTVAVFGIAAPVLAFVLPTAVGAPDYEYAVAVAAGAAVLAFASLASALAFGPDAEPDPPAR
jgi:cystathionine beta-lyase family protein involved in aluminum resistance